jgi:hypothetical protein
MFEILSTKPNYSPTSHNSLPLYQSKLHSDKTSKELPVYYYTKNNNKPLPFLEVANSENEYYDAYTDERLSKPPQKGDKHKTGETFHVGNKIGNKIYYHGKSRSKQQQTQQSSGTLPFHALSQKAWLAKHFM